MGNKTTDAIVQEYTSPSCTTATRKMLDTKY